MSNLCIRGLDQAAVSALKDMARQQGASVNTLMLKLINQGLGLLPVRPKRLRYSDLDALAGTWSAAEAAEFEAATELFGNVDPALWQ